MKVSVAESKTRFVLIVAALCLLAAAVTGPILFALRAPATFAIASSFIAPVVVGAIAFGVHLSRTGWRGRAPLPKPPYRRGALEPRPFSPAQRRRPRS
jgi:hypothetical protein